MAKRNLNDRIIKALKPAATGKRREVWDALVPGLGVRVTDTGCGISEQDREAVLRRFYRSDKIRNTPGVGLGLNLVAAIVKLHGFRLAIHSGPAGCVEIICPDQDDSIA